MTPVAIVSLPTIKVFLLFLQTQGNLLSYFGFESLLLSDRILQTNK